MAFNLASLFTNANQDQGTPSLTGTDQAPATTGNLLDQAVALFGQGANIYAAVTGKQPTSAPSGLVTQPAPTASDSGGFKKYLPWILGGVAALAVLYFIAKKR